MDHSVIIFKYNISISLQDVFLLSFDPEISTCTFKNKLVQSKTTTTTKKEPNEFQKKIHQKIKMSTLNQKWKFSSG